MAYEKPWLSIADQLALLAGRGMDLGNADRAAEYLERIGYYRLSGYWFAFRERSGKLVPLDPGGRKPACIRVTTVALDRFKAGTTFRNAVELYVFDKKLRLLAMDALERIEIALRVDIAHTLGELDPFAYLHPEYFHREFGFDIDAQRGVSRHHEWLSRQAQLIVRSKEDFVRHNRQAYGLPLAIWVASEIWDFGTLSTIFSGMREIEQDRISSAYGLRSGRVLASWLRSLNYLRNVCAHHSRLWNRNIVDQPRLPGRDELAWVELFEQDNHLRARCFLLLRIARHLMEVINPQSSWAERMQTHLMAFPDLGHLGLNLRGMGVPDNWTSDW